MSRKPAIRKILWALDIFQENGAMQKNMILTINEIASQTGAKVYPVYVLSPDQLNLNGTFPLEWVRQNHEAAEEVMEKLISNSGVTNLQKGQIVASNYSSITDSVRALLKRAKRLDIDLIVIGTHAREGLARLMLGSFAETLLLHSKIPLIVVNPDTIIQDKIRSVAFTTDLSKVSRIGLLRLLPIAKALKLKIELIHVVPRPFEGVLQSGAFLLGGGWVSFSDYLANENEKSAVLMAKMEKLVERSGVTYDSHLITDAPTVVDGVLECAKKLKVDAIVTTGESGPLSAALLGSVTRQIVRHSALPVWEFRVHH